MKRLALIALLALAFPAAASAHATLKQSSPSYRGRVETAPRAVVLRFDQAVEALPGSVRVLRADGSVVSRASRATGDGTAVVTPLRHLPAGAYTVRWHVLSTDGHVVSGVYTFGVRVDAPPPTSAVGAGGPTRVEHVVRWAYFVGLALLLGGIAFRLVVLPRALPPRVERRFFALSGIGVFIALESGIAAFILRAEDALQLPFRRLLYGDLSPVASGTRFGAAFIAMTLGFALVAALLFLAWLLERRALLWSALLVGLGFASGLSLSGHSGASRTSVVADWVHLSAACVWVGGLVQLGLCVWPAAPELRAAAFLRFSRLATVLIALVLAAGTYLSVLRLPQLSDLWSESYGRVLVVKLALVAVALAWGGFHHFFARPALERGEGAILARLPRSLVGESAVAIAVLLAAAVLVDSKPPAQPPPAPGAASSVSR